VQGRVPIYHAVQLLLLVVALVVCHHSIWLQWGRIFNCIHQDTHRRYTPESRYIP